MKLPKLSARFLIWTGGLVVLLIAGVVSGFQVLTKGLIVTNMNEVVPWGLWITVDLSSIGLGAGAFTLSAFTYLLGIKRFQPITRVAVFIGFLGYTGALLTLLFDIGRPDRFWHPWLYWNMHSVLWEIVWCITLYTAIMLVELAPMIGDLPQFARWPRFGSFMHSIHKTAPALAVLGLGLSLLHQSSLGATYGVLKGRPIWFKPSMPIMFILSAVAVGPTVTMAACFIYEWLTKKRAVPHDVLFTIARFSGFALLAYLYIKLWDLAALTYYGRLPAQNEALALLNQTTSYGIVFWVGEILLGILFPVVIFLSRRWNRDPVSLVMGAALAVGGLIMNRWDVTISGLTVPLAYSPGTLYQSPTGVYSPSLVEWGIALGVIGYMLFAFTLGVRLLPIFSTESHKGPV